MIKTLLNLIFVSLMVFMVPSFVLAETTALPEVMVGQAKVIFPTEPGIIVFGGMTGNEAVINYEPNINLGFKKDFMVNSATGSPPGCWDMNLALAPATCFSLDPLTTSIKTLNSRTSIDGVDKLEVATLLYPANIIIGDAYTDGNYLNNFAFYGRNLNQSSRSSVPGDFYTWELKNYALNPQAQASFSNEQRAYYNNRVNIIRGEGQEASEGSVRNNHNLWYLQGKSNLSDNNSEADIYPEGKIWTIGSGSDGQVNLAGEYRYRGVGTLVVDGNLVVSGGSSILASGQSSLGIIVTGNLTIRGNVRLNSTIFCLGTISVMGNAVDLQGSYVASNFSIANTRKNVMFRYDYKYDEGWPPGFRYFSMPTATNESM
jgi:hypothetical protein